MLNVYQHETGEEVSLPENCKQYTFNHRLNQSKHRQTHSCEKPAGKANAHRHLEDACGV